MIKLIFSTLLLAFIFSSCVYAADPIEGRWLYVGTVDRSGNVECPDIIVLNETSHYYVLNDCYGADPINPITETGEWVLEKKHNMLVLSERSFKSNYYLINKSLVLRLPVIKLTNNDLILGTILKDMPNEKYKKLSSQ